MTGNTMINKNFEDLFGKKEENQEKKLVNFI